MVFLASLCFLLLVFNINRYCSVDRQIPFRFVSLAILCFCVCDVYVHILVYLYLS